MEFSKEELAGRIRELEGRLAVEAGDVLAQVRLGELRRRFRGLAGEEAPRMPGFAAGNVPGGRSGEGDAIAPGGVAIGQICSRVLADSLARTGGDAKTVFEANRLEDIFTSPEELREAASRAVDAASGPSYPSALCRLECHDAGERLLTFGTGFLVAPRLVLTCRHVLPADLGKADAVWVQFTGPRHKLRDGAAGVWYALSLRARAVMRGGRPDLWHESPPFRTAAEFAAGHRDLALLEVDAGTERWGVHLEADLEVLRRITTHEVLARAVGLVDPFMPCLDAFMNEEDAQNVELLRIAPSGGERTDPGTTDSRGRLSWHSVDGTEEGDSGSPLVRKACGLVGMHHSRGTVENDPGMRGRFVHVRDIRTEINGNAALGRSGHAEALKRQGWM